ncbi:MAG TPA: hypothetical protein VFB22_13225 [Candidatus Baltobacteraceae bacterium]|nr:hypothetical protein [Candidatus Baltobacteraceae bacterium]
MATFPPGFSGARYFTCRGLFRRAAALAVAFVQIALLLSGTVLAPLPALATSGAPCVPNPGKDGAAGSMSSVVDEYFTPRTGTLSAGATSVRLSSTTPDTAGGGASSPALSVGDELLIIQMQDGTFTTTNGSSYGTVSSLSSAGLYEYVYISAVSGTTITIVGAGSGNGLLNSYHEAAASSSHGQEVYQIIRVPQYTTGTLTSNFHAAYWDGKTGGVAAVDMASLLTLGGASVYATGDGFRGGGLTDSGSTPSSVLNNDFLDSADMNGSSVPGFGSKGEGIFGTPANLFWYTSFSTPSTPGSPTVQNGETDGYPSGDMGMGAPGNAGGGGDDDDPAANDENTGGGGGSNGGAGGNGGYPWTPVYSGNTPYYPPNGGPGGTGYNAVPSTSSTQSYGTSTTKFTPNNAHDIGGRGAAVVTSASVSRAFMGGGGGAGVNNNGSNNNAYNEYGSSGGTGGGIVMMRLSTTSGSASLYADGTTGLAPLNDGGGGGGAGGTIIVTAPPGHSLGVTAYADGAAGTTANATNSSLSQQHGPGGGGGGGVIMTSASVTSSVTGGAAGTTTTSATTYGATAGAAGSTLTVTAASIPGVASGGECNGINSTVYTGPLSQGSTTGYNATGSYDGVVGATNDNDFTAKAFYPAGMPMYNISSTPGTWQGNVFKTTSATTIDVPNELYYNNDPGGTQTLTLTVTAPTGWTGQVCPDSSGSPSCASSGGWTVGAAGQTSSTTYSVAANTLLSATKTWTVYTIPSGTNVTAFNRYDATLTASDTYGNTNTTHNELYPGFVVLTKNETLPSNGGCPAGDTIPANGLCPGAILTFSIDYRNIVAGASSEPTLTNDWPWVRPGTFVITENGTASGLIDTTTGNSTSNTWGASTFSCGLNDALVAGANGTTTFGDSTANSTFTGGTVKSTSFTDTVGGSGFALVPSGITSTANLSGVTSVASQGTLWFRVMVVPATGCP